jgi:hypothetical protein
MNEKDSSESMDQKERAPFRVRLPRFVAPRRIGLGTVLKRMTYAVGIKPCGGCKRRAAALDRRVIFFSKPSD